MTRSLPLLIGSLLIASARTSAFASTQPAFSQKPMLMLESPGGPALGHLTLSTAEQLPVAGPFDMWAGTSTSDDFSLTTNDPVVSLRWWGGDLADTNTSSAKAFVISFASDLPPTADAPFNHPWQSQLSQIVYRDESRTGRFQESLVRPAAVGAPAVFEYNAQLALPFWPSANVNYWLTVTALTEGEFPDGGASQVGWGWQNRDYSVRNEASPNDHQVGALPHRTPVFAHQSGAVDANVEIISILLPDAPVTVEQSAFAQQFYKATVDGSPGIAEFPLELAFELFTRDAAFPDTNSDGIIDLRDLNNVRNHFGAEGSPTLGDTNGDNRVDMEDLNSVRNNFGQTLATSSVPEPNTLILLTASACCFALRISRRKTIR